MKQYILLLVLMVMGAGMTVHAEDVNPVKVGNVISGHIIEKGTEASLPYATILIVETGQGTVSDENGEFVFKKIPAGKYTLRVQLLGYETQEKKVTVSNDFTVDIHFLMNDDSILTDEVVVSANRNEVSRRVAPVVVNVMNSKLFETVNSTDLAKSLNYQSGLRVENNCQNCGFPQVRINGLEGPYSQILINSRPVVSALSGDVMKESAQAGYTYIRSRAKELHLDEKFYETTDIHIHLPEGAIPKDGPSAGITMVTAMVSALTKRCIKAGIAMTGEITLSGKVLPVGGIKEKMLAAHRYGVKTILLPEQNMQDLEELPVNVRAAIKFIPVNHMDQVLKLALEE